MEIKATVKGKDVTRIEIGGRTFPLIRRIPIEELPHISQALEVLSQYIDFAGVEKPSREEWTEREIFEFLTSCNERQTALLDILLSGEMSRKELTEELGARFQKRNLTGKDLGGALAGIANRTNQLNKEPLYELGRKRMDGNQWSHYYSVNPKYKGIIQRWLAQKHKTEELLHTLKVDHAVS